MHSAAAKAIQRQPPLHASNPMTDAPDTAPTNITPWEPFPEIDLRQMLRMTDDTGMFQHATYAVPDPNHGYCIDDNARALIASLLHAHLRGYDEHVAPLQRYLAFLAYAFNEKQRTFRNFMGYDRRWLEEFGSQDSQGRAIWALGLAVQLAPNRNVRELAQNLFERGLVVVDRLEYIRSWAFVLIGLEAFLAAEPEHGRARQLRDIFAEKLFDAYRAHATDDWPWWEDTVTYDNAKLTHALLICGKSMRRPDMIDAALKSLRWLLDVQTTDAGHISIIGNHGWLVRGDGKAQFDQQPLEAYAMVHACLTAAELTGDKQWADEAWRCFEWFRGYNDLGVPLYHEETGGCQDGLQANGPNKNQGAESVLAYLLSTLELHRYREMQFGRISVAAPATIGYGIIGASSFAAFCLDSYLDIDGLKPVAVWNRTASKARRLADKHAIKPYDDLATMLDDPGVQLVHVASTPAHHAEHALIALNRGKHVLCEKPIATTGVDAQQMLQAAAERDLCLCVNFVMRFGPLAVPFRDIITTGVLGAPLRGFLTNRAGDGGLPPDHWFWDETESGGIFVEHGVHFFDLVRSWLGEGRVLSAMRMRRPGAELIDQVAADVRYGEQAAVTYYHGFHQSSQLDQQDFRLILERGEAVLTGWIAGRLDIHAVLSEEQIERITAILPDARVETLTKFEGDRRIARRHRNEPVDREVRITWQHPDDKQTIYGRSLRALMEDVVATVRDRRRQPRVTAQDGRAALELALDADRFARGITP